LLNSLLSTKRKIEREKLKKKLEESSQTKTPAERLRINPSCGNASRLALRSIYYLD